MLSMLGLVFVLCQFIDLSSGARVSVGLHSNQIARNASAERVDESLADPDCVAHVANITAWSNLFDIGDGLKRVCTMWPASLLGGFPADAAKFLTDEICESRSLYQSALDWLSGASKNATFCWRPMKYAPFKGTPDPCPETFNPEKDLFTREVVTQVNDTESTPFICTKDCDELCSEGGTRHHYFWCKCKVVPVAGLDKALAMRGITYPSEMIVNRFARPKHRGCHTEPYLYAYGAHCYSNCPSGYNAILGGKYLPVCAADCAAQEKFNVSCGVGCASSSEHCADEVAEMILAAAEQILSVGAVATGQVEAVPMIHALVGLIDILFRLGTHLVTFFAAQIGRVKPLPFYVAVGQVLHDLYKSATDIKKDGVEVVRVFKKVGEILGSLVLKKTHATTWDVVKNLVEHLDLSLIVPLYRLFKTYYHHLCAA